MSSPLKGRVGTGALREGVDLMVDVDGTGENMSSTTIGLVSGLLICERDRRDGGPSWLCAGVNCAERSTKGEDSEDRSGGETSRERGGGVVGAEAVERVALAWNMNLLLLLFGRGVLGGEVDLNMTSVLTNTLSR